MLVDRWNAPGAPRIIAPEVRSELDQFVEKLEKLGLSLDKYLLDARDAFAMPALRDAYDELRDSVGSGKLPRYSTLAASFKLLLQKWGRRGWVVIWPRVSEIARVWGVRRRQAFARLKALELLGLVKIWRRWENFNGENADSSHDPETEARSNVMGLFLPEEMLKDFAASLPGKRRVSTSPPVEGPPPSSRRRETSKPARSGAASPSSSPAASSRAKAASVPLPPEEDASSWFPSLFHAMRSADPRYRHDTPEQGGYMAAAKRKRVENIFADEAGAAHEKCLEHTAEGVEVPDVSDIATAIATLAIRQWLREDGNSGGLLERRHAIGLFSTDAERLAHEARLAWQCHWFKSHPTPPHPSLSTPQPRVPVSIARQVNDLEPNPPPQPRVQFGMFKGMTQKQLDELLRIQQEEARAAAESASEEPVEEQPDGEQLDGGEHDSPLEDPPPE